VSRSIASPLPVFELGPDVVVCARPAGEGGRHLRGHSFTDAYVDEAALVADATVEEAILPTLADAGGRLTLSSTPGMRGGLLHRLFERGQRGDDSRVCSFHFPSSANPHIDRAFVDRQREELSHEQWSHEWLGEWLDPIDSCFRWEDVLACAVGTLGRGSDGARFVAGFDPAKTRDRSALVVIDAARRPSRVAHLEDLAGQDYARQVERVAAVAREFGSCRVAVDATGAGAVVVDLLRAAGVWVEPIVFTAARKVDLITGLIVTVEKREIVFPPNAELLGEFRWMRVTRSTGGTQRYEAPARGKDDYLCALALALAAGGGSSGRTSFAALGLSPFLRGSGLSTFAASVVPSGGLPDDWGSFR
jgi:hypothetical protein